MKQSELNALLMQAVESGNAEDVHAAIDRGTDIHFIHDDMTPLIKAAFWRLTESLDALLERGADINGVGRSGCNALHFCFCVEYSANLSIMKRLIDAGIDINSRNEMGDTPLMYVLRAGIENAEDESSGIALLLDAGTDISILDVHGRSAYDLACAPNSIYHNHPILDRLRTMHERGIIDRHTPGSAPATRQTPRL